MRRPVLLALTTLLLAAGTCTACGSSSGENACEASATRTISEEELDKKC
jgi:hypothetical protein